MKTTSSPSLLLLGLFALAFTACGKAEEKVAPPAPSADVVPVPAVPAPTTAEVMAKLKSYTYEQRADFLLLVQDLGRQANAAQSELTTGYIDMKALPARRKAMEALRLAAVDFKEKTATLDNAQTENWESIRANLTTSWQNLQGALDKARAEVPKA